MPPSTSLVLCTLSALCHAMPGLPECYDLESASDHFGKAYGSFIAFRTGAEEHRFTKLIRQQRCQPVS